MLAKTGTYPAAKTPTARRGAMPWPVAVKAYRRRDADACRAYQRLTGDRLVARLKRLDDLFTAATGWTVEEFRIELGNRGGFLRDQP